MMKRFWMLPSWNFLENASSPDMSSSVCPPQVLQVLPQLLGKHIGKNGEFECNWIERKVFSWSTATLCSFLVRIILAQVLQSVLYLLLAQALHCVLYLLLVQALQLQSFFMQYPSYRGCISILLMSIHSLEWNVSRFPMCLAPGKAFQLFSSLGSLSLESWSRSSSKISAAAST